MLYFSQQFQFNDEDRPVDLIRVDQMRGSEVLRVSPSAAFGGALGVKDKKSLTWVWRVLKNPALGTFVLRTSLG